LRAALYLKDMQVGGHGVVRAFLQPAASFENNISKHVAAAPDIAP